MALGILGEQFAGGIQMRVFANTGENIQDFASVRPGVLHTICSDERQSMRPRQIDQFAINAFFTTDEMALKLNKNILGTEGVDEKSDAGFRILGSARASRAVSGALAGNLLPLQHFADVRWTFGEGAECGTRGACAPQTKERHQPDRKSVV